MPKLIGIVGYAGAGKTTTTRAAIVRGGNFHHMGFSDPFKRMLAAVGITSELYDDKSRWNEPIGILNAQTLRYTTRKLGDFGRAEFGDMFWTNIALREALNRMKQGQHVIIDNVRYPSEFDALKAAGATMIAFHRDGLDVDLSHSSEQYIGALRERCDETFWHSEPFGASNLNFARLLRGLTDGTNSN